MLELRYATTEPATITDKVLTEKCDRLGINFSMPGHKYVKKPMMRNFEGIFYRQVHPMGNVYPEGFQTYVYGAKIDERTKQSKLQVGAEITIIGGPYKGRTRTIKAVELRDCYPSSPLLAKDNGFSIALTVP